MGISYSEDQLSSAEVVFAQASQLLYCEPDSQNVANCARSRMFATAPYGMESERVCHGLELMSSWLDECAPDADAAAFEDRMGSLRREWFRLFLGAGTPDAPCWESFYREPNSHLFGKRTLEVRDWYRRYGLQIEKLYSEPDDHLGLMLGFVSRLVALEADALAANDEEAACKAASEQEEFLSEHVLPWLAAWRYSVEKSATSDYFRGVGELVFGLCELYAGRFDVTFDEEAQVFKKARG